MKSKITVKSSDSVRCTSSSVHNETRIKNTASKVHCKTEKKEGEKRNPKNAEK